MKTLKLITPEMVSAVVSVFAGAYESDFHFGLTWWLASQAGFDARQSQEIARQNELTDTGMLDAKPRWYGAFVSGGYRIKRHHQSYMPRE